MTKCKYMFLLAYVSGSEGNCEEDNNITCSDDLIEEYKAGNPAIFAKEYYAFSEEEALAYGYRDAFFENYTAHDTVSIIYPL